MKKYLTLGMAVVCCLTLLVASLAFFTDKANVSATGTAGNIDLEFVDASEANPAQSNTQAEVWTKGIVKTGDVMNPGDTYDLSYTLSNDGSKSIDVKHQFVIESNVALSSADAGEYTIVVDGKTLTGALSNEGKTLTYDMTEYDVLKGSVEQDGEDSITYDTTLTFSKEAKNAFMNNQITVTLTVWAKQHRNTTDADWASVATYETAADITP